MKGMQQPSLNLAHLASVPKYPWQRSFPVLQSTKSQPLTGTVTCSTPPVHPSQQPPSTTEKGVYQTAMLQRGRWRDLADVMQTRGSWRSQVWSPSKGLQLLQEKRPAQLLLQEGQMVAWKVSPFLMGLRLKESTLEMPPQLTPAAVVASSSTVRANPISFIYLSTNYYRWQKITADQQFATMPQANITDNASFSFPFVEHHRIQMEDQTTNQGLFFDDRISKVYEKTFANKDQCRCEEAFMWKIILQ